MKILVLWADHRSPNLGVRALAAGTEALLQAQWGDATIEFQTSSTGPAPERLNTRNTGLAAAGFRRTLFRWMKTYDLVIDTGAGDSFADIYGLSRPLRIANLRRIAVNAKVPLIVAPQTIGPFTTRRGRAVARVSFLGVRDIFARDPTSLQYASRLTRHPAVLATDVVFALERPVIHATRDVIFNVSGLLWNPNLIADHGSYRRESIAYCRSVLDQGRKLSLLAHVLDSSLEDNDVPAVEALARELGGAAEQLVPSDLHEARAYLASGRLTVGSRMHACLNSLSVGVPAIPWAYSRKFEPLLADLGWRIGIDLATEPAVAARSLELSDQLQSIEDTGVGEVWSRAQERLAPYRDALADVR